MKREYSVSVDVGAPRVAYREAITKRADFDWLHKKQSGGQGQYARVVGYLEPVPRGDAESGGDVIFVGERSEGDGEGEKKEGEGDEAGPFPVGDEAV